MNEFLENSQGFIAVASDDYFASPYCRIEFEAAFDKYLRSDGEYRFLSFRIADVKMPELTQTIVYGDLFGIADDEVEGMLLEKVDERPVPRVDKAATEKATTNLPLMHNLPERNLHFSGRESAINSIREQFGSAGGMVCLKQTIAGLGGVGKTEIAKEYAHRYADEYPDAICWINAESDATAFSGCLEFARRLGLVDDAELIDTAMLGQRLKEWQNSHSKWLFVFDNVEKEEAVSPYVSQLHRGHILFTARRRDLRNLGLRGLLNIDVFLFEEAFAFMRESMKERPRLIENSVDLAALIERMGRLPLALEQAAAYMRRTEISCGGYLGKLDKIGLTVLDDSLSEPTTDYRRTVNATFTLSFEKLSEGAQQLYILCSYMAANRIPLVLFTNYSDKLPQPLRNKAADDIDSILAKLLNYSLITRDGGFISTHRFVQEVCRERQYGDKTEYLLHCLDMAVEVFNYEYGTREDFDSFAIDLPHVLEIAGHVEEKLKNDDKAMEKAGLLYNNAGFGLKQIGEYVNALEWHNKALAIREKKLGLEHPDTATTYNNIATVYKAQGDYGKALEWYRKAYRVFVEKLGEDHPSTKTVFNNAESAYHEGGYSGGFDILFLD